MKKLFLLIFTITLIGISIILFVKNNQSYEGLMIDVSNLEKIINDYCKCEGVKIETIEYSKEYHGSRYIRVWINYSNNMLREQFYLKQNDSNIKVVMMGTGITTQDLKDAGIPLF